MCVLIFCTSLSEAFLIPRTNERVICHKYAWVCRQQLLVFAVVNILGGSVHTVKTNAEAVVVSSMEIGLKVNADKTKYMLMSRDQNAGRSQV